MIVLSLNNSKFGDYVDGIYTIKLIKDTTDIFRSASYVIYTIKLIKDTTDIFRSA